MDHLEQNVSTLIVIVNWRSPWDTLECLESLLQQNRDDWAAVVVDNASGDDSISIFESWADGRLCGANPVPPNGPELPGLRYAALRPKVSFINPGEAVERLRPRDVIFIPNGVNGGFAAGNNVGLRLALRILNLQWVWLLNNDTVVDPDALSQLIAKSSSCTDAHMVGASVMEYYNARQVQYNAGARYNKFTAKVSPIKRPLPEFGKSAMEAEVEECMSYVVGASMFLAMSTFKKIGLMREDYFLYYEELDWIRPEVGHVKLLYASDAKVYHKEGGATGGKTNSDKKSWTAEYYSARSRLLYTLLNHKTAIIPIFVLQLLVLVKRIVVRKDLLAAKTIFKATKDALHAYGARKGA